MGICKGVLIIWRDIEAFLGGFFVDIVYAWKEVRMNMLLNINLGVNQSNVNKNANA